MNMLRVAWVPQVPMESFKVPVESLREAKLVLDTLAHYDLFLLSRGIRADYANAGWLQEFDPTDTEDGPRGSWIEWTNPDTGDTVQEMTNERITAYDRCHHGKL